MKFHLYDAQVSFVAEVWAVWAQLAPWMLVGMGVAGILHGLLPSDFVARHLGRSGTTKAVLLGVPLPLCSCGVIPAGLGLKKDGASDGAAVGFLISTPQTGVDSFLVSASFLGWPFALFKIVAAFLMGIVGGLLTDAGQKGPPPQVEPQSKTATRRGLAAGAQHSLQVLRSIYGWLIFGALVSAAISWWTPPAWVAGMGHDQPWLAMGAMLILSLPLYVCATASVPIAAALVGSGFPLGAALVFLMAGPATNVATLGAVYRVLGGRPLFYYLGTIVLGSLGAGLFFEQVVDVSVHEHVHVHGANGVEQLAAWGLLGLSLYFAGLDGVGFWRKKTKQAWDTTLTVTGMTCGGCENKLTRALLSHEGVDQAVADASTGQVLVRGTISSSALREAAAAAGYPAVQSTAQS